MGTSEKPAGHSGADAHPVTGPEIEFAGIGTDTERGHHSLDGVSFTVAAGSITALMGAPDGGKSLLMRHLLDEDRPDEGRVLIDGQSLWDLPGSERARFHDQVGVLRGGNSIKESELDQAASVRENLSAQLSSSDRNLGRGSARTVEDCLTEFDLTDVAESRPSGLDPATERRLGLAVALLADPAVVVIDDPGTAIDVNHLQSMTHAITGWHRRTRATIVLAVHSIELARALADHLVVLDAGRVVETGDPKTLLEGMHETTDFEQRFGTTLSYREADPENLRRRYYRLKPFQLILIAIFLVLAIGTVIVLLTSGITDTGPRHEGIANYTVVRQ